MVRYDSIFWCESLRRCIDLTNVAGPVAPGLAEGKLRTHILAKLLAYPNSSSWSESAVTSEGAKRESSSDMLSVDSPASRCCPARRLAVMNSWTSLSGLSIVGGVTDGKTV